MYHSSESSSDEELVIDILPPKSMKKASNSTIPTEIYDISCDSPTIIELNDSDSDLHHEKATDPFKCRITTDLFKCRNYKCTSHRWSEPDIPKNTDLQEQTMQIGKYDEVKKICRLIYPNFKCRSSKCTGHSWKNPEGEISPTKKAIGTQTDESRLKTSKVFFHKRTAKERKNKRGVPSRGYNNVTKYYFVKNYFA